MDRPALLAPEPGPATLKTRRWGGARLAALRRAPAGIALPIGESWEFSTLPGRESHCGGQPLSAVLGRQLPFLAKLLDTAVPMSIQVHPDDDLAAGQVGKEEAWIVLEADPGATVLAGFADGVSPEAFRAAVLGAAVDPGRGPGLIAMLRRIVVRPGTIVLVPAGTVHSIGGGILLAEIQQPTDCTFRLFDYGSGRELHVTEALAAARTTAQPVVWQPDQSATRLAGKHLAIEVVPPGRHLRFASADELLVGRDAQVAVHIGGHVAALPCNELRLVIAGSDYALEVPPGASVVVGTLAQPGGNRAGADGC